MLKIFAIGLLFFVSALPIVAAESQVGVPSLPGMENAGNIVLGLSLPADQTVNFDEGYVRIDAKCKGDVKWLVVANAKVKFLPLADGCVISIPPQGGQSIHVFAVGLVDGKLTDFAKTTIIVQGETPPQPTPQPTPQPSPPPTPQQPAPKLHVTFLADLTKAPPEQAKLLYSQTLRQGVSQKGYYFRLYDINSSIVASKKLDAAVKQVGGSTVMIIQKDDGTIMAAQAIPKTEAEIFNILQQIGTGK